jgi:peptide/nickel transport system substrate-binding protein
MYNGLVRYNLVDGLRTILPDLSTAWEITSDQLQYTFTLRSGVKFHDGSSFSADDVVASFQRIIAPPEGIISVNKGIFGAVDKIEAIDPMTVRFTLKAPRAYFLDLLADSANVVLSKKTLEENKGDLKKIIAPGTGAFQFKEHRPAERWIFEKNPNYWDSELPYLDQLELIHVPAWSDRGTGVLSGQLDMSWNISRETWDEGVKRKAQFGANRLGNYGCYAVMFNTKRGPLADARVRRAIHLAVSRQDLITAFETQEWINLTRWIPYGNQLATPAEEIARLPGFRASKRDDIAEAKRLMADAGFANGIKGLDFLVASVAPHAEILGPAFQDQLKQTLNIDCTIRITERALQIEDEQKGNFDMVLDTPGHAMGDLAVIGNAVFRTGASRNYGSYSNATLDGLLNQYEAAGTLEERAQLAAQAQDALDADPPWFLVGYTFHLLMWQSRVKGLALDYRAFAHWGRVETAWIDA